MFTQSAYVLVYKAPSLDDLAALLGDTFTIIGRTEAPPEGHWALGGASLLVQNPTYPEGRLLIDVVDRKWPDDMGDPQRDPILFAAWSAGAFGPGVFPGNLERAGKQAWAWKQASGAVRAHQAWIRVRSTFGGSEEGPQLPESYSPLAELNFVTKVCAELLTLQTALALFNPNGESLRPRAFVEEALAFQEAEGVAPVDVWTNVRVGKLNNGWMMMDTVGMAQLGLPDVEACFRSDRYTWEDVDRFLREVQQYLTESGDVIKSGDELDGPPEISQAEVDAARAALAAAQDGAPAEGAADEDAADEDAASVATADAGADGAEDAGAEPERTPRSWEAMRADQGLHPPPRPTLRLLPIDGAPRTHQVTNLRPMDAVIEAAEAELRSQGAIENVVVGPEEGEG